MITPYTFFRTASAAMLMITPSTSPSTFSELLPLQQLQQSHFRPTFRKRRGRKFLRRLRRFLRDEEDFDTTGGPRTASGLNSAEGLRRFMNGISKTLKQQRAVLGKHYRRSLLGFASVWSTLNTIWRAIWSTLNAIWRAIWSTLNAIWRTFTLQSRLRAFLRLDSMEDANACLGPDSI